MDKAKHNLKFVDKNISDEEFNDWTIIALYYAIYHASLALLAKKGYISKNHNATLIFIIKEYSISKEEALLIEELSLTKEDVELYTSLKEKRQYASYSTDMTFDTEKIKKIRVKVIEFINKVLDILE